MTTLPGFSFLDSRYPEVLLVALVPVVLLALIWIRAWRARRCEIQRHTDMQLRRGFRALQRQRLANEDTQ